VSANGVPAGLVLAENFAAVREAVNAAKGRGLRVGFVPTMGALHAGHVSLMEIARRECDFVVASIFVNPTQFGPNEDFTRYPRTLENDLALCAAAGVSLVFHPTPEQMYPKQPPFGTFVEVTGLSEILEGAIRPGHFRGVTTVVLKLFEIVGAHAAYFGQKDFQQQTIIRQMVRDLNLPVEVRVCPTIRETDGLALSSRNIYLQGEERPSALALSRSLKLADEALRGGETDLKAIQAKMQALLSGTPLVKPDYAVLADPDTLQELIGMQSRIVALVAARVGKTRLIDNLVIEL
jgi:pantoate--beta-alanine ligase